MPRAWGRPCRAHGDVPGTRAAEDAGRRGRRPLPQMSPWPPCARAAPTGGRDASAGRARRPRRAARRGPRTLRARGRPCRVRGTRAPRAWGRPGGRGPPGTSAPTMRYQANAWLFQKFPCVRRTPYRGNVQRGSHPLSDILAFYRMSPTFPILSVCSVAAKPFCVFCAVVARHAGRRNHISLCQTCGCEASAFRRRPRQARPSRFPADATSASLPFPGGRDKRVPPVSPPRYTRPSCF